MAASPEAMFDAAQNADLDAGVAHLVAEARAWAAQLRRCADLAVRAGSCGRAQERRFLPMEVAGSWRISQITATRWLDEAERVQSCLPRTLALLEAGELFVHQARVLLHRTAHCTRDITRAVEAEVLPAGAVLCPSDLSRLVERTVLRLESEQATPEAAEQRHADAAAERRVYTRPEPDGMALVGAVLTAEQQVAWSGAMDTLERRERRADRAAGIRRTVDQRRADIFAALPAMVLVGTGLDLAAVGGVGRGAQATGGSTGTGGPGEGEPAEAGDAGQGACVARPWTFGPEQLAGTVVLNLLVPVSTVLGLSRAPGTLSGYGPVSAEHIRLLRPASFRRVLADSVSGRPISLDDRTTPLEADPAAAREQVQATLLPEVVVDTDEAQHDPSARLDRLLTTRDPHCTGPGCSATSCHNEHHEPWPTGPTSARNLHRLSPRCHAAKHAGWTLERHPDGSTTWRSPLRRTYTRPSPHEPPPKVDLYADPPPVRDAPVATPPWATAQPRRTQPRLPEPPRDQPVEEVTDLGDDHDEPPPF